MMSMRIELKEKNQNMQLGIRKLANACNITRIDGNEYFGNDDENDFENFALFMIELMNDKGFLDNCSLWHWDEWEDGDEDHFIDDVLEEIKNRR